MKREKQIPERWIPFLEEAAEIVRSYKTRVTLRQLHYRLVSRSDLSKPYQDGRPYTNTLNCYTDLSYYSAIARRDRNFPDLLDTTRWIHRHQFWKSPEDARQWLAKTYRRDRMEGQPVQLYVGVEKGALTEQLTSWFGDYGIPVLPVGGYASQSFIKDVQDAVLEDLYAAYNREYKVDVAADDGRPAILLYAGDCDPSGENILPEFLERTGMFTKAIPVALTEEQVDYFQLPRNPGKPKDTRAKAFALKHGGLWQVELDALNPTDLRQLYQTAIDQFWDQDAYQRILDQEAEDKASLA